MNARPARWFIGLMSGTSLDGIDGVLVDFCANDCRVAGHVAAPLAPELAAELLALHVSGPDELHRAQLAANALARGYAAVVRQLLAESSLAAGQVCAIGAHGQTVRHRPQAFDGTGYTIQLNNPALLAELTGITVVADLRSRDIAAGGQGAPLVPAFHRRVFGQPGHDRAVLNLGGIANLTLLRRDGSTSGWDCGPANTLMDQWCQRHTGQAYDNDGRWAASGQPLPSLLQAMLGEPYFTLPPPKSTGRDLFNGAWLQRQLAHAAGAAPVDVQATLAELTAQACARDLQRAAPAARELIVCGGGARNGHLMRRLQALLPGCAVASSAHHGLPPQQVEAAAFAWLAQQCIDGRPGNLPAATGARGPRILGAIHQA